MGFNLKQRIRGNEYCRERVITTVRREKKYSRKKATVWPRENSRKNRIEREKERRVEREKKESKLCLGVRLSEVRENVEREEAPF